MTISLTGMFRKQLIKYSVNWQLFWFSWVAASRGALYALPVREVLPAPLDLMPSEQVYFFGLLWFIAAGFGVFAATRHKLVRTARRLIVTMLSIWALIYAYGALVNDVPGIDWNFWLAAALYAGFAAAVHCKPPVQLVTLPSSVIDLAKGDSDAARDT